MRAFPLAALNRCVGNEPGVAATTLVASASVRPAGDVALVLIRNSEREPVDIDLAVDGEMKNVFVAIVEKSFRADRLEMAKCAIVDRDRLDPVNRVLQNKEIAKLKNDFVRQHRIRRRGADVEKERAVRFESSPNLHGPRRAPFQIRLSILTIGIFAVSNAEIVGRRRDDKIHIFARETGHSFHTILETQIKFRHEYNVAKKFDSYKEFVIV